MSKVFYSLFQLQQQLNAEVGSTNDAAQTFIVHGTSQTVTQQQVASGIPQEVGARSQPPNDSGT